MGFNLNGHLSIGISDHKLESLNAQFYRLLENIQVNETVREYDVNYIEKYHIYK